jgi:transcriptional regulatory protein LevR
LSNCDQDIEFRKFPGNLNPKNAIRLVQSFIRQTQSSIIVACNSCVLRELALLLHFKPMIPGISQSGQPAFYEGNQPFKEVWPGA